MLEEIIAGFLSLFSAFTSDVPRVSKDTMNHESALAENGWCREYGTFEDEATLPLQCEYEGEIIQMKATLIDSKFKNKS